MWDAFTATIQHNVVALAQGLGYLSIAFWLCAQFPQVVKNYSLQSCEGLSLPFLVNWLFGDITNLIGCLLTDQLPFQTYLAAYFCLIDFTILGQFFYYRSRSITTSTALTTSPYTSLPPPRQSIILRPSPSPRAPSTSAPIDQPPLSSISSATVRPRPPRRVQYPITSATHPHPGQPGHPAHVSHDDLPFYQDRSYAAIYEAALDVARTAERAHQRRSESRRRLLGRQNTEEEEAESRMIDSFHSDLSTRHSSSSTSTSPRMSASTGQLPVDTRGRSLLRSGIDLNVRTPPSEEAEDVPSPLGLMAQSAFLPLNNDGEMREARKHKSRSLSLVRVSGGQGKGRRAAGVAFMSVGLLVMGGWIRPGTSILSIPDTMAYGPSSGMVMPSPSDSWPIRHPNIPRSPSLQSHTATATATATYRDIHENHEFPHPPPVDQPPSLQRVIGRVSAWVCTTLYLTSRLPQIWKNFTRKSVEGLSILLFLFAFCGNLAYVLSIVLNPSGTADQSDPAHYLLEALPYLLGSGGTLLFDLTIMIQSWIYGSSPPIQIYDRPTRRPRRRHRHTEDGLHGSILVSAERDRGGGSGERQTLISSSVHSIPPSHTRSRSRSLSKDVGGLKMTSTEGAYGGYGAVKSTKSTRQQSGSRASSGHNA